MLYHTTHPSMITKNPRKGAATVVVVAVVAAIGVGGFLFSTNPRTQSARWKFWKSTPAQVAEKKETVVEDSKKKEAEIQAKVEEKTKEMLGKVQESAVAADVAAGKTVAAVGTGPGAKEASTTKVLTGQTVAQLNTTTGQTVDPKRITELENMVSGLNAGLATAQDALKSMQVGFDAQLEARKKLEAALAAQEAKTLKAEADAKAANEQALKWAAERDAVASEFERLKFGAAAVAVLIVGLWVASIVLPLLAKVFPAVQPAASVLGAVWSPGVQAVASGARKLSSDLVALNEFTKDHLSKELTPAKLEAFKSQVKDWWGNDHAAQATIEKIKESELRR